MKKKQLRNSHDFEKFGTKLILLLPMKELKKIFSKLEKLDGETPLTLLREITGQPIRTRKNFDVKPSDLQGEALELVRSKEFAVLVKSNTEENIKSLKENLKKDPRYSLLLKLINLADEKIGFVSFLFLKPFLDVEQNFIRFCKPHGLIKNINSSTGERRKNFLVELFKEISEPAYRDYLEVIWKLSFIAQTKIFSIPSPKFGELVNQAQRRLRDYPRLVIGEMKLLRNSFAHNSFEYNLEDDSFIVWDEKTPKTKLTADEITNIANEVTSMCIETFPSVAILYCLRNCFLESGLLECFLQQIPSLTSGIPSEIAKAEAKLLEFQLSLTKPPRDFFQKPMRRKETTVPSTFGQ